MNKNKLINPYNPNDSLDDVVKKNKDNIINMDTKDNKQIEINKENIEKIQKEVNINKKNIDINKKDIDINKKDIYKDIDINKKNIDINKKDIDINKDSSNTNKNSINVNKYNIDKNIKNIKQNKENINQNTNDIKKFGAPKIVEIISPIKYPNTGTFEGENGIIITQYTMGYPSTFMPINTWIINKRTIKDGKTFRINAVTENMRWEDVCELEFIETNKYRIHPAKGQFYFGISKIE